MTKNTIDLKSFEKNILTEMQKALIESGNYIEADSVKRCPKDTGELRRNHEVIVNSENSKNSKNSNNLEVTVAYEVHVPEDKRYGHIVHECPNSILAYNRNVSEKRYRHGKQNRGVSWDIGEDHFLQKAIKNNENEVIKKLTDTMKKCLNNNNKK